MRFLLLSTLLGASLTAQAGPPPGYHAPHRYLTPRNVPYRRLPLRLNASLSTGYYNGDISSSSQQNNYRVGFGAGLAKGLSPHLTFALDLSSVRLGATDVFPERGLAFQGNNTLLTALLRFNIWADKSMLIGPKHAETPFLVFLSAGLGSLLYNPVATQYGIALPPEAGNSYPAIAGVLPFGGGVTLRASPRFAFTLEGLYFLTTTDMLDDVSQRGNPKSKDDFATLTFKVEYSLLKRHPKPLVEND